MNDAPKIKVISNHIITWLTFFLYEARTAKPKVTDEIKRAKVSVKTKPKDSPNSSCALGVPGGTWLLKTANAMKSVPNKIKSLIKYVQKPKTVKSVSSCS